MEREADRDRDETRQCDSQRDTGSTLAKEYKTDRECVECVVTFVSCL